MSAFVPAELIRKKRLGHAHSRAEIAYLIEGYVSGQIPDYQISAWLMAICFAGMNGAETAALTEEMRDSGIVLNLEDLAPAVDKHSTGGLGDKTSLLLAPIVACAGIAVPMMAGRGLGHTGGTLDKLESLAGFNVNLSLAEFRAQLEQVGAAIIGQTREMCPADRKLYALRDVTATVESLPLICASIMSKKLAEGMSALVLDVKVGSGAFMKTPAEAEALARALADTGRRAGKQVVALITRMDEPLGRFLGNAVEVRECLDILDNRDAPAGGKSYADTIELTLHLAGYMLWLGKKAVGPEEGQEIARSILKDGRARAKFGEICRAQGADPLQVMELAPHNHVVLAPRDGYFVYRDVEALGRALVRLGAGRQTQAEKIDFAAGAELLVYPGENVREGDPLMRLFSSTPARIAEALPLVAASFDIVDQPRPRSPLIQKVL